jgi:hypothetical protein
MSQNTPSSGSSFTKDDVNCLSNRQKAPSGKLPTSHLNGLEYGNEAYGIFEDSDSYIESSITSLPNHYIGWTETEITWAGTKQNPASKSHPELECGHEKGPSSSTQKRFPSRLIPTVSTVSKFKKAATKVIAVNNLKRLAGLNVHANLSGSLRTSRRNTNWVHFRKSSSTSSIYKNRVPIDKNDDYWEEEMKQNALLSVGGDFGRELEPSTDMLASQVENTGEPSTDIYLDYRNNCERQVIIPDYNLMLAITKGERGRVHPI